MDFDDHLERGGYGKEVLDPVHTLNFSDTEAVLKWTKDAYEAEIDAVKARAWTMFKNRCLVKGCHYSTQNKQGDFLNRKREDISPHTSKVVVNEMFEYRQQRSSRLSRFTTAITAVPHSNEHSDKEGAQVTKAILDTIAYSNNFERMRRELDEDASTDGEAYVHPYWDEYAGDLDKTWAKAKAKYDEFEGKKKKEAQAAAAKIYPGFDINEPKRIGDICYRRFYPWQLILDPQDCPEKVEWVTHFDHVHIKKLEKLHGVTVEPTETAYNFDFDNFEAHKLKDHALVFTVWARSTRYLPHGMQWVCTPDKMLSAPEHIKQPWVDGMEFGDIPLIRVTDIDISGELHGTATFNLLAPLQHYLNQFYTLARRNIVISAHPKFLIPKQGKVNITNATANDATVVEYFAPYKPTIETAASLPPEVLGMIELLAQKMTMLGGTQPISKGDVPSNVRSGRAIRLLEELEALRSSGPIKKSEELMVKLYKVTLALIGKHYKDSDERLIRILGTDKKYQIDSFKASVLHKPYDIRVLPSSALPQTPGARLEVVTELMQIPTVFESQPKEVWLDALNLGAPGKIYSAFDASLNKAEWENEQFIQGKVPNEPGDGDDHIVHWSTHNRMFESKSFLEFTPEQQKQAITHQMIHEMEMVDKADINPAYYQELFRLKGFPKFYRLPRPLIPMGMGGEAPAQGQPQQKSQKQPAPGTFAADQQLGAEAA